MEATTREPVRLGDVIRRIAARRLVLLGTVVAVVGLATSAGLVIPKSYTATAVVTVSPITTTPFSSTPLTQQINIETERNVMSSTSVAAGAVRLLQDGSTPASLLSSISVSSPPDSLVLRVSFVGRSPKRTAAVANAFADAYLEYRAQGAADVADRIIKSIEGSITEITSGNENKGLSEAAAQAQILALRQQQQQLSGVSLNTGRVIGPAVIPTGPSSPGPKVFVAGGLALGLLGGLVLALLAEQFDPRVRRADRLARATGHAVMAGKNPADEEPYRRALMVLTTPDPGEPLPRPLLISVVSPGASSAWAAHALGAVAADAGRNVGLHILTDLDNRRLDRGWPGSADLDAWQVDIAIIDSSGVSSATRRELLAQRTHRVLLVSTSANKRGILASWIDNFENDGGQVDAVLFQRRPRPAPEMPARPETTPPTRRTQGRGGLVATLRR